MNNEEFETMSQNAKTVINKFRDNPGKFAATILKMYWDMEKQRDQYKVENEELKHQWDYLYESLSSLQEDYNDLEQQYDELFRRYEMLNELI